MPPGKSKHIASPAISISSRRTRRPVRRPNGRPTSKHVYARSPSAAAWSRSQAVSVCRQEGIQRHFTVEVALPRPDYEQPLAGGNRDVVEVEGDELAQPGGGVEQQRHDRPVARLQRLGRAQQLALRRAASTPRPRASSSRCCSTDSAFGAA